MSYPDQPVEPSRTEDGCHQFVTPLDIVDPVDLEMHEVPREVARVLEGYLIAFRPGVVVEDEE